MRKRHRQRLLLLPNSRTMDSRYKNNKGFTLIELLVVIAIVSLLSSVIFASVNSAREKAKKAKARQEILLIVQAAEHARGEYNGTLMQVTGSYCTACAADREDNEQMAPRLITALQNIIARGGNVYQGIDKAVIDPWGQVYYLDENEGEYSSSDCRRDYIRARKGGNSVFYRFSYFTKYCQENPAGIAGWQGSF